MLTDLQDSVEANALVRRNLAQEITVNSSVTTQEKVVAGVQPGYSRYLVSRYTFVELHNWKSAIRASLLSLDAVSAIDIDEVENRISVGVVDADAFEQVKGIARGYGVPDDVVHLEIMPATEPVAYDLYGRNRPLTGGYYVGPAGCTMTGTALRYGVQVLMTASHCTTNWFSLDYGTIWQGSALETFGWEQVDPSTYKCGTLFSPKHCRRSDVAAYNVSYLPTMLGDTLSWKPGLIAKTSYPLNGVYQMPSTIVIDSIYPYWTITATANSALVGSTTHKVGQSTGWTYGSVWSTCVDKKQALSNVWLVCSDIAGMYADLGDSGSPVFIATGGLDAMFVGVVWGKDPGAGVVYSNFGQMQQDLGAISFW